MSSLASSSCCAKSSSVNGSSVGEGSASPTGSSSSGSWRSGRCAYEPISRRSKRCRSYMPASMSRTIGNAISAVVPSNQGTGATSIIWWTAGVSGIAAPAIRASLGLQTPQAITIVSASTSPAVVRTRRTCPCSTSIPTTSTSAATDSRPLSIARSRISSPARIGSTIPTEGVQKPPSSTVASTYGTSLSISSGVIIDTASTPHDAADDIRRQSSCIRSSVRATSIPPDATNVSRASYCSMLSSVRAVISFEWSTGKMKFEAWPVEPPGFGSGPLSIRSTSLQPSSVRWYARLDPTMPLPTTTARARGGREPDISLIAGAIYDSLRARAGSPARTPSRAGASLPRPARDRRRGSLRGAHGARGRRARGARPCRARGTRSAA